MEDAALPKTPPEDGAVDVVEPKRPPEGCAEVVVLVEPKRPPLLAPVLWLANRLGPPDALFDPKRPDPPPAPPKEKDGLLASPAIVRIRLS